MPDEIPVKAAVQAAPQVDAPQTFDLSVEEYCVGLSKNDGRPELIYAFSRDEIANGRVKDSEGAFAARFASFASRPA